MRGIRGATTVEHNNKDEVIAAVRELLEEMLTANKLEPTGIGAAIFSATRDVDAVFPAFAARTLEGWDMVPLFDAQQLEVEGALPRCIRVLLLTDLEVPQSEVQHIYHQRATSLRPDLKK